MNAIGYRNLHFPSSIIQRVVWLYTRFNLSLRDVEEPMAERGVEVTHETTRRWVQLPSVVTVAIKLSQRGALPPVPLPGASFRWAKSVSQSSL